MNMVSLTLIMVCVALIAGLCAGVIAVFVISIVDERGFLKGVKQVFESLK
jgi:hypothetical protein